MPAVLELSGEEKRMSLRTLLERVLRNVTIKRSLPKEFGHVPIFVSAEAGLRYIFRPMSHADPALLRLAQEVVTVGSRVWDIGANIGLFSLAAAHCAGKTGQVVAVEADIMLAQMLQRSARIQPNHMAPVEVIPAAVAINLGIRKMVISQRARATNHLADYDGSTQTGGIRYDQTVVAITLDLMSQFYPAPNVLKIDVEGAELEVLKGGISLLERSRPILICEVMNQSTALQVGHLLHGLGYQMFNADLAADVRVPLNQPFYNTLATPTRSYD